MKSTDILEWAMASVVGVALGLGFHYALKHDRADAERRGIGRLTLCVQECIAANARPNRAACEFYCNWELSK